MPLTVLMSQEPERLILKANAIHRWRGRKRGRTLLRTYVGTLLLTDRRLLHLSAGGSGVPGGIAMVLLGALPGAVGPAVSLADAAKKGIDWVAGKVESRSGDDTVSISEDDLRAEGTLNLPLESIEEVGLTVRRLWMHLWLAARMADGEVREFTFSDQMTMPNGHEWEPAIRRARAELLTR